MKREILCASCNSSTIRAHMLNQPRDSRGMPLIYPGEHVKRVYGRADCARSLLCDVCSVEIKPGDEIVAVSTWSDYSQARYYEWERSEGYIV